MDGQYKHYCYLMQGFARSDITDIQQMQINQINADIQAGKSLTCKKLIKDYLIL